MLAACSSTFEKDGYIVARIAGLPCKFLIDSGAQVNTITEQIFMELCADKNRRRQLHNIERGTDRPLKAYASAVDIPVVSTFEAFLEISNDRPILLERFYVVKEARSLLGRATATRYSVLLLGLKVPVQSGRSSPQFWYEASDIAAITEERFPRFNIPPVEINYDQTKPP